MSNYKKIKQVRTAAPAHMVGDGFKVRNFIGQDLWNDLSPFLMLDYNEPWEVGPTQHPRGVDVHPHKGFETVSIAWSGRVAHEDSSGGKGEIGPGDVQWMTAGSGILHKEFHAESFSKTGGIFHMAQLWVNLPANYKNTPPSYQDLLDADMGRVQLENNGGELRVIAGEQMGVRGPARTFTRMNIYDAKLNAGGELNLALPEGDNTAIVIMEGNLMLNDEQQVRAGEMVILGRSNTDVKIESNNEAHLLILSGEPIAEPISAYGPFVMNTKQEILEAIEDYNAGKFGTLQ
jgi:redox-sensitive bicupin YhaK (pirin superfamily)